MNAYPPHPESIPARRLTEGRYEVGYARSEEELDAILRLRFEVFNLELGEGLAESYETERDRDPFDAACHHLLVRDTKADSVVGCYRIQTYEMAREQLGFYSAGEFDLNQVPLEVISRSVEVGRACVAQTHRSSQVLFLLWKGLAMYLLEANKRYLFGCSSLTSQDPKDGLAMLAYLRQRGFVHPKVEAPPLPGFECSPNGSAPAPATKKDVPPLFRSYLRHGVMVCGPPAIDREFKTIDFLTLFDVESMPRRMYRMFFES